MFQQDTDFHTNLLRTSQVHRSFAFLNPKRLNEGQSDTLNIYMYVKVRAVNLNIGRSRSNWYHTVEFSSDHDHRIFERNQLVNVKCNPMLKSARVYECACVLRGGGGGGGRRRRQTDRAGQK